MSLPGFHAANGNRGPADYLQGIHLKRFYQPGGDEAKKELGAGEQPAEMGLAGGAEYDLPATTREPGEFAGRFAAWEDTRCLPETAEYKGDSRWIEKSVFVPIVYLQHLIPVGDDGITDRAENCVIGQMVRGDFGTGSRRPGWL